MTEMTRHELTLERTFDAPRELVWQCYTDPAHLTKWWGPAGMHTPLDKIKVELRPGGAYHLTMVDGAGNEYPSEMTIREVRAPEFLAFGWDAARGLGGGEVTVELFAEGDRTRLVSVFVGDATPEIMAGMEQGTNQQLDKLVEHLAAVQ
jgi:uncharacterized protein YndB with AHSA1/START domain